MNNLQDQAVVNETIFTIVVNILGFVTIGAFLGGVVGFIIYFTSGGNEGRIETGLAMMRSAGFVVLLILIVYATLVIYAKIMGIEV